MLKAVHGTCLVFTDGKEKAEFEKLLNMESLQPLTTFTRLRGQKSKDQRCSISASTFIYGWKVKYFEK